MLLKTVWKLCILSNDGDYSCDDRALIVMMNKVIYSPISCIYHWST